MILFIADFTLIASIVAITLGIKPRIAVFVFIITKVGVLNYQYSFGKIDHEILLPAMLACMSFSGWGLKLALWPDRPAKFDSTTKCLSLLAVLICFGYFTAGFEKAINWINFDLSSNGSARWFYNSLYNYQRQPILAPLLKTAPFWLFKIMDFTGVLFELMPFAALLYSRKAWQTWLLMAAGFHLINLLFFNINFIVNGIVYMAFIDYSLLYNFIKKTIALSWMRIAIIIAIIYAVGVRVVSILTFEKVGIVLLPYNINIQLYGMLCLWTLICITILIDVLHSKKRNLPYEIDVLSPQLHKNNLIDHQTTI
ncbi:hypothetical protein LJ707_00890 [Mucilaginibacter sp. UR6-1]|uniref:hypothetical protein n=1 Tax=Mucilaginibacter sp. UR6-1 TaxID=1435643 RepID=UPI001E607C02|nr:hypothetical protein [Mucilaginibacter sp. UR6-1]MCC8407466.1 hypothetical protein [Mucilaginibacter sp. UR6-1]